MKIKIACAAAGMWLAAFSAQAVDWQAEWQLCSSVKNDQQRLACFDGIAQRYQSVLQGTTTAEPSASAAPVVAATATVPAPAPTPVAAPQPASAEQSFGMEQKIAQQQSAELDEITAEVTKVSKDAYGKLTLTLANQQRWKLQDKGLRITTGDEVVISRGTFGSFYLNKVGQSRNARAKRLD